MLLQGVRRRCAGGRPDRARPVARRPAPACVCTDHAGRRATTTLQRDRGRRHDLRVRRRRHPEGERRQRHASTAGPATTDHGGKGADTVDGGTGDDHANGSNGDDALLGRKGADSLIGGAEDGLASPAGSATTCSPTTSTPPTPTPSNGGAGQPGHLQLRRGRHRVELRVRQPVGAGCRAALGGPCGPAHCVPPAGASGK